MATDTYVVLFTQLNRLTADGDPAPLTRGQEFTAADLGDDTAAAEREIKRWLGMKPAAVMTLAEFEKRQQLANPAQALADAQAEADQLRAELAAAQAQLSGQESLTGDQRAAAAGPPPARNAGADKWREWAAAQPDLTDADRAFITDPDTSRDDLVKRFAPSGS